MPRDELCIVGAELMWSVNPSISEQQALTADFSTRIWREFEGSVSLIRNHGLERIYVAVAMDCEDAILRFEEILVTVSKELGDVVAFAIIDGPISPGPSTIEL